MNYKAENLEGMNAEFGRQFLLTHLNEISEDWRYLDKRIETTLNLYVTVVALVVTAAATIYSDGTDWLVPLRSIAFAAVVLVPFGFITARRVKNAAILRSRKRLSTNLIKKFFQERHPEIEHYLPVYVSTPKPIEGDDDEQKKASEKEQIKLEIPYVIIWGMYSLNSLLVIAAVIGFTGNISISTLLISLVSGIIMLTIQFIFGKKGVLDLYID